MTHSNDPIDRIAGGHDAGVQLEEFIQRDRIEGAGIQFRAIPEATCSRLGLPAVNIPADVLMLPGFFGFLAHLVTLDLPASNVMTRQALGWEPAQPGMLADWTTAIILLPADELTAVSRVAAGPADSQVTNATDNDSGGAGMA